MPPSVDLISNCDWICHVLDDVGKTLVKAGYKVTPKILEECQLTLLLEASNLRAIPEQITTT